jgi:nitrite reductase/ring-hydroxylating ferredoxin subunit
MKEVDLGPVSDFTEFPASITIKNESYYLTRGESGYSLLSRECPHAGGEVIIQGEILYCPLHMWRFDSHTGKCLHSQYAELWNYPVTIKNDRFIAEM